MWSSKSQIFARTEAFPGIGQTLTSGHTEELLGSRDSICQRVSAALEINAVTSFVCDEIMQHILTCQKYFHTETDVTL